MKRVLKCLSCGQPISPKEEDIGQYCVDCITNFRFDLKIDTPMLRDELKKILDYFASDIKAAFEKDPAARSLVEVLTSYPGTQAILLHRIAHFFEKVGLPYVPRFLSYINRQITGIDIHPGAKIGRDFFIDHGSGTVIGETAEIGDNVTLYQNVTLGGTSLKREKRHPTLGNNIVVGAGAKILGPVRIGDNVKVGANSVVTKDVPSDSVVVGVPGRVVARHGKRLKVDLLHGDLPDPILDILTDMQNRIEELEKRLNLSSEQKKRIKDVFYLGEGI